jgi:hypothetical protein
VRLVQTAAPEVTVYLLEPAKHCFCFVDRPFAESVIVERPHLLQELRPFQIHADSVQFVLDLTPSIFDPVSRFPAFVSSLSGSSCEIRPAKHDSVSTGLDCFDFDFHFL